MQNPLLSMVKKRKSGIHSGIPSFCSANKLVIEAILEQSQRFDEQVLIEATSNQVNQFGGYTRMQPADFRDFVYQIADKIGFTREKIILGGDHLGPLPWADKPAEEAMKNAEELVRLSVAAGYKKIHLDTSMKLGDDSLTERLSDEVIAERGARLYKACEDEYKKMLEKNPDEMHPVFVIGSEVPVPGGNQKKQDDVEVTKPEDFENTLLAYKKVFAKHKLGDAWNYIIAIVVQPGVEFGNLAIHPYNRIEANNLCESLKKYPDIVFEGHSTDYQAPVKLKEMVEDGIAIIKVGPALTFAMREALFALAMMEKELIPRVEDRSNFIETLDAKMDEHPEFWQKYYKGDARSVAIQKRYGFSDRSRYCMAMPEVENAMNKMFANLDGIKFPMGMLHQYMPLQYIKVRDGSLSPNARDLAKYSVVAMVEDYNYAVKHNYMISGIFL